MLIFALLLQEMAVAPGPSPATPFDMTPYYQGTLEVEQGGEQDRMLIDADGRYNMVSVKIPQAIGRTYIPNGTGRWAFDKDKFCVLADPGPYVGKQPVCMDLRGRKTGDSWTLTFGDQKVVFKLKAGRPKGGALEKLNQ